MSRILMNTVSVDFMVWETMPKFRKKNNRINVVSEHEISIGDVLVGQYGPEGVSSWEIKEITSVRDSNLPKKKYYELVSEWKNRNPNEYKGKDLSLMSFSFKKYIDDVK